MPDSPLFLDPRRRGFRSRTSVAEFVALIDQRVGTLSVEEVPLGEVAGRVLAAEIRAVEPVPPFDRAAMDGFALRGEETFGADSYTPALFTVIGRSRPGRRFGGNVGPGEAVEIATGAPLPAGADTVVPVEIGSREGDVLRVVEATPPGRHVSRTGEDIEAGVLVLARGRVLRPQDLGVLSALGISVVPVVRRPAVTSLITGDELLPAGTPARGDQIADMNSVVEVRSHNAVAAAVSQGRADWGVAIEPAAHAYGLAFLPLRAERYDFAIPADRWDRPAVAAFRRLWDEAGTRQMLAEIGLRTNGEERRDDRGRRDSLRG